MRLVFLACLTVVATLQCASDGDGTDHGAPSGTTSRSETDRCAHETPEARVILQAMTEFVSGYNDRDATRLRSVFSPADLYDPVLLVFGLDIRASSTDQWVEAGWSHHDLLAVAESCVVTGPTPGVEIVLRRMNDSLRGIGVTSIDVSYKLQTKGKVVTNFVGDRVNLGEADRNPFCSSFSQAFRDRGLEDLVPCS